jgi:hypothetical protein
MKDGDTVCKSLLIIGALPLETRPSGGRTDTIRAGTSKFLYDVARQQDERVALCRIISPSRAESQAGRLRE